MLVGFMPDARQPTISSADAAEDPAYAPDWGAEAGPSAAYSPFADSTIWDDQTRFFEEFGTDAWTGRVPYHVTNNINIATSAAQIALAFMRDYAASHPGSDAPFPIVELGAGIGRFGFYLTRALVDLTARLPGPDVRFVYWMTDRAESNLDYLRSHPLIAQQIAAGHIKLGIYDPTTGAPIRDVTEHEMASDGGEPIPPFERPVIAFANYFFDSLPVDFIRLDAGAMDVLYVSGAGQFDPDLGRNEILSIDDLGLQSQWRPISTREFSHPSHRDLAETVGRFGDDGWLIFPTAGLRCLDSLRMLSDAGYLLAASDKGLLPSENRLYGGEPRVAFHGAVSTGVNFPLLAQYVEAEGGWSTAQTSRQSLISVLLSTVADWESLPRTRYWTEQALNDQGHFHLFHTYQALYRAQDSVDLSLAQLLSFFALIRWDPIVVSRLWPAAESALISSSERERDELRRGLQRSSDAYFPVPGDDVDIRDIMDRYLQSTEGDSSE